MLALLPEICPLRQQCSWLTTRLGAVLVALPFLCGPVTVWSTEPARAVRSKHAAELSHPSLSEFIVVRNRSKHIDQKPSSSDLVDTLLREGGNCKVVHGPGAGMDYSDSAFSRWVGRNVREVWGERIKAQIVTQDRPDISRNSNARVLHFKRNVQVNAWPKPVVVNTVNPKARAMRRNQDIPGELIALLHRCQGTLVVLLCLLVAFFKRDNLPAQVVQAAAAKEDRGKGSDRRPIYSVIVGSACLLLVVVMAYWLLGIQSSRGQTWGAIAVLSAFGLAVYCIIDRLLFDRYWWRRGLRSDGRSADHEKEGD